MLKKSIAVIFAALCLCGMSLYAQSSEKWKVVKDKETKKYGFQDSKTHSWVVAPEYDKAQKFVNGVAVVTNYKKKGLINEYGELILPFEFKTIEVDKKNEIVQACRHMRVGGNTLNANDEVDFWGIYGLDGHEILSASYEKRFSFNRYGLSVARFAPTGMYGVISKAGDTILPFDFIEMKKDGAGFKGLDKFFLAREFNGNGYPTSEAPAISNGFVEPYATDGDDIKAIVYHRMFIGRRMQKNNLRAIDNPNSGYTSGRGQLLFTGVKDVVVDDFLYWGDRDERFVRLFLSECEKNVPHAMSYDPSNKYYTIQAEFCDKWGKRIGIISEYGWFESKCNEGVIYNAQGDQLWFLANDINLSAGQRGYDITGYVKEQAPSIQTAFRFKGDDNRLLENWKRCRNLKYDIVLKENAGLQSYEPVVIDASTTAPIDNLESRFHVLSRKFSEREVYRGKFTAPDKNGKAGFKAESGLVFTFTDNYKNVGLKNTAQEAIYWGSNSNRYIKLDLIPQPIKRTSSEPKSAPYIWDDATGSPFGYTIAVNLYEPDGTYVRNLGISKEIRCCEEEIIILSDLGLAFTSLRPDDRGRISFQASKEHPNKMSVLTKTLL